MAEARGIEHKVKAPSESNIDAERNGLHEVDNSPTSNRCNNESHQENSIPNVNFNFSFITEIDIHFYYIIINMNIIFITFRNKKLMK